MSVETAAALAEAAASISDVDRVALARYVMWVEGNLDPEAPEDESVLRLLESLR